MAEYDKILSTKIKYSGFFNFRDLYQFCHDWLVEDFGLDVTEKKYQEKLAGDAKEVEIEWEGYKKVTDYFKFKVSVKYRIIGLKNVEINQGGKKIKTNDGSVEIRLAGTLIRDYAGKFETNAFRKFLRSVYEKWVIPSRIDQMEGKLFGDSNEFLEQTKAFLTMEGKK